MTNFDIFTRTASFATFVKQVGQSKSTIQQSLEKLELLKNP